MAIRGNHYDAAFEAYLRSLRVPYVAVDETRRALAMDASLKSMDFLVYPAGQLNLIVDVKGRKFPSGSERSGRCWENWATQDDVRCLLRWEEAFGSGFRSVLVFAYDLLDERAADVHREVMSFRGRTYAFYGVWVSDYAAVMSQRSRGWDTVNLSAASFRRLRFSIPDYLRPQAAAVLESA